jgi:HK97 family phage portal protein
MFGLGKRKQATNAQRSEVRSLIDAVFNSTALTWERLFGVLRSEDLATGSAESSLKLTAIRCALQIYTSMAATCPRRMYALDADTGENLKVVKTTDSPASRLFSHYFNDDLNSDDALVTIVYDVLMHGNSYFLREKDSQGRTARLHYVHPTRIPRANIRRANGNEKLLTGRTATKGELVYRIDSGLSYRDRNDEAVFVPKADISHFKGTILDQEHHRAFGFLENSGLSVGMYQASEEFGYKFYSKGIATQMFLTTENRLSPDVLNRLQSLFEDDPNAPLENIFKTRILEQGLKPVHMGIPFQHLQFIETRAFSVEDVSRAFNIPPVLLHSYMGTEAGKVDIAEAMSLFIGSGIGPFLDRIGTQYRNELLPLASQMNFSFQFEKLYLYRHALDKFTTSLRNLFEIGVLNRTQIMNLLGGHIDPRDPAADPRYVPVNLMTVEHSLHLQEQADLANQTATSNLEMLDIQKEGQRKAIERADQQPDLSQQSGTVKPDESPRATAQEDLDNSPSKDNIDKRLRTANNIAAAAFRNVVKGLYEYQNRVLDSKRKTRENDYEQAVMEFYAEDSKFADMLNQQLLCWDGIIDGKEIPSLITKWLSEQKLPEELNDEIIIADLKP